MAILPGSPPVGPFSATAPARLLPPQTRQQLALDALGGQSVTELAAEQQVSRKFVYQQLRQAHDALDHAFNPGGDEPDQLLFWLPVTKPWLRQLVLGLTLIGHSSRAASPNCSRMSLTIRSRSAPFTTSCTRPSPLHAPSPHGKTSLPSASAPRRDLPGRPACAGRRRCRLDLLLPAQFGRAPRRRYLGRTPAGTERTELPTRRHHRRFRRGIAGRTSRGLAGCPLSR